VTFGPYTLPPDVDRPIYLRAGLYDADGDTGRTPLIGAGEKQRTLLGRIVPSEGGVVFERAGLAGGGDGP